MKSNELSACKYIALGFLLASILLISRITLTGEITARPKDVDGRSIDDNLLSVEEQRQEMRPIKSIHLIGERHSATKWITKHLEECFGDQLEVLNRYTRYKHWFQYDDIASGRVSGEDRNYHPTNSSLVVAMFRDPYEWVDSMRKKPYHSPNHFDLDWKEFLTTPWTMARGNVDEELLQSGSHNNATCMHRFSFNEVVPCSKTDRNNIYNETYHGRTVGVVYEMNHDGSGQPYDGILDLRRDKVLNFLDVANFHGVASFFPVQFEYVVSRGTGELVDEIEHITGLKARCKRVPPRPLRPKDLDAEFIEWMNEHIDWKVEKLIGYSKRYS